MIASFDLGAKNFAFAVKGDEEFVLLRNTNLTDSVTKTDLGKHKKDVLVEMMANMKITPIQPQQKIKKKDMIDLILEKNKKNKHVDVGQSLFKVMDDYSNYWEKCKTFLIERQMTKNLQALKLSHFVEAYLKMHYPSAKIINYNASLKTKKFGAKNLKTKFDRKKWTINYTLELLQGENLRYFESLSKQDDVADVVCMIEAYLTK